VLFVLAIAGGLIECVAQAAGGYVFILIPVVAGGSRA